MILIWKPPAMLIAVCSIVAGFGVGFMLKNLGWLDEKQMGLAVMITAGATALVADVLWRRSKRLGIFDLRASTLFWILPTWLLGALLLVAGVLAMTPQ